MIACTMVESKVCAVILGLSESEVCASHIHVGECSSACIILYVHVVYMYMYVNDV